MNARGAQPVDVLEPWELTREQWNIERERLRPNVAQSNFTKASASEAIARNNRLQWLLGGVRDADRAQMQAAMRGEIQLSREEAEQLHERLQTPVTYDDVIARGARVQGRYNTPSGHDYGCEELPPGHAKSCTCGARVQGGAA